LALFAACASSAFAQNNLLAMEVKDLYQTSRYMLMRAAEKMPESEYAFKPTASVRTFGEEVAHAAQLQMAICGAAQGEELKNPAEGKASKADLLAALKTSSDYCDSAYAAFKDSQASQIVQTLGRDWTKLGILYFNVIHNNETYGTMVPYLRMKNIVPPSSEPRRLGRKK
jgi:uncharacterized damage-inducible protein DinB